MPADSEDRENLYFISPQRVRLDERFFALFLSESESPQDRIEAQELRQIVHQALQELTREELRVIELRYQHKKSPGQVASQLGLARQDMQALEKSALEKLRQRLQAWHSEN